MTADRDPQVAALLDVLESAPPRPGFWEDLEDRLRSEPTALDLVRLPNGPEHQTTRRRRTLVGIAAAAAVVAAVVGGLALREDDRERGETVPVQPGPSTSAPVTTAPTTPTTYAEGSPQRIALQGADAWIGATQAGDDDLAWALLGGQSREQLGSEAALADLPLEEEWAPYVDTPDRHEVIQGLGEDLWMIVLTVDSEADLVPPKVLVVNAPPASEYSIDPYFPGPALDLIGVPAVGEMTLMPGAAVPIHLDADASVIAVVVDGNVLDGKVTDGSEDLDAAEPPWLERDADGAVIGVRPQPELAVGVHWIAVLQIVDGALAADARAFEVGSGAG